MQIVAQGRSGNCFENGIQVVIKKQIVNDNKLCQCFLYFTRFCLFIDMSRVKYETAEDASDIYFGDKDTRCHKQCLVFLFGDFILFSPMFMFIFLSFSDFACNY